MRNVVRSTLVAGLTGTLMVGAAWAGIGIAPVPVPLPASPGAPSTDTAAVTGEATAGTTTTTVNPAVLGAGQLLVGAAKNSMYPDPEGMRTRGFPNAVWEKDPAKCKTLAPAWFQDLPKAAVNALDGIANPGSVWPENPSCIYQGGFSLGPTNPVKEFDKVGADDGNPNTVHEGIGLWVRSMAFSDGKQTLITTVIDGEGWLWDYRSKCTDCGAKQIAAALGDDTDLDAYGVSAASHVLHATHSHASPDFIGGWGFVPNWYMKQITDTIKATAKQAVLEMEAATLEAGEQEARQYNNERRDTYRSAEEAAISWVRAVAVEQTAPAPAETTTSPEPSPEASPGPGRSDEAPGKKASPEPSPSPTATETETPAPAGPRVIATLGAYAAHPTAVGTNGNVAHADWPGLFAQRAEQRFGGIGMHFMTGLGNLSNSGGVTIGTRLADLLPAVGAGRPVTDTTVKVAQTLSTSALTNVPLTALGTPGLFDRKFDSKPAVVNTGENAKAPCLSASAQSVELPTSAARIGNDLVFTAAPGEVFANYTNTVEEKSPGRITFALAQANDSLGYMPQSFEINPVGQQGLGFAAGGFLFVNYEDSYAIDRCTGDLILEDTLKMLDAVKK